MANPQEEFQSLEEPVDKRRSRLSALLEDVAQDASQRTGTYLQDSVVPEGGE